MKITGENIFLRTPISADVEVLFSWENNPDIQEFNLRHQAYSLQEIETFVNGNHDLKKDKQLRLMICENSGTVLGTLDLFNYNSDAKLVGIGIIIFEQQERKSGKGTEAMELLIEYLRNHTNINQLYCNIGHENKISLAFFGKLGFKTFQAIKSPILMKSAIPGLICLQLDLSGI